MAKKINKVISLREFNYLKNYNYTSLTVEEKDKLRVFEAQNKGKKHELNKLYFENLKKPINKGVFTVKYENLLKAYLTKFEQLENKKFDSNQLQNLKTILYYFAKDERFFKCKNLFSDEKTNPNFDKGLLIIGGVGNGKSTTFKILKSLFSNTPLIFKNFTTNQIVDRYEAIESNQDKELFKNMTEKGTVYYDDMKTEREASNYGKRNLFKSIIEERYNNKAKTYITCNYSEKADEQNLNAGLYEFHDKYGARVYDRIFEMFNIIEFNGKSLRK